MSHLLPQSSHWLQVLQCCSQIAPGVCHPGSCPEPSGRLFLLLLLRWAKVRKSHPSAGKPPIKHQKNFTSLGYMSLHKFIKNHENIPKKSVPRPGCCFWFVSLVHYKTVLHCISVYKTNCLTEHQGLGIIFLEPLSVSKHSPGVAPRYELSITEKSVQLA